MVANLFLSRALAPAFGDEVREDLAVDGVHVSPARLDAGLMAAAVAAITLRAPVGADAFLTEREFDALSRCRTAHCAPDPVPGCAELERIEGEATSARSVRTLLGPGVRVVARTLICGVCDHDLPDWVRQRISQGPAGGLTPYVRPEHRAIAYTFGSAFGQEPPPEHALASDLVVNIYLRDVGAADAPVRILEGSHLLGACPAPDLMPLAKGLWRYADGRGQIAPVCERILTGPAGLMAAWHPFALQRAAPNDGEAPHLALRCVVREAPARP